MKISGFLEKLTLLNELENIRHLPEISMHSNAVILQCTAMLENELYGKLVDTEYVLYVENGQRSLRRVTK